MVIRLGIGYKIRVLGKLSRPEGYKKGKALWNQQRKILWNIKRVLGKAGKGKAVEMDPGGHYPHLDLGN